MGVTGEQFRALAARRCVDDGVGGGQFVFAAQVRREQCDGGVQGHDDALLRVGDHLVGLVLRGPGSLFSVARDFLFGGRHFMHGRGHLIGLLAQGAAHALNALLQHADLVTPRHLQGLAQIAIGDTLDHTLGVLRRTGNLPVISR